MVNFQFKGNIQVHSLKNIRDIVCQVKLLEIQGENGGE